MNPYPRLWPELAVGWRDHAHIQFGLGGPGSLIIGPIDTRMQVVFPLLDGSHHRDEICRAGARAGIPRELIQHMLELLQSHGFLVPARTPGQRTTAHRDQGRLHRSARPVKSLHQLGRYRLRLVGAGVLGQAVARALVGWDVGSLVLCDGAPANPGLYPNATAGSTQAQALADSLSGLTPRLSVSNHWSKPEDAKLALTVVTSDSLETDRLISSGLVRLDQPHLLIRALEGGAVVGPLVLPGRSPCLQCLDLARRDVDSRWPVLLQQFQRINMPVAMEAAHWAGEFTAVQALGFLHGGLPETVGGTVELTPPSFVARLRPWQVHPRCGCGWTAPAEWAP